MKNNVEVVLAIWKNYVEIVLSILTGIEIKQILL